MDKNPWYDGPPRHSPLDRTFHGRDTSAPPARGDVSSPAIDAAAKRTEDGEVEDQWVMTRNGRDEYGPYTMAELREYAATGRLLPADHVCRRGSTQWVPANSLGQLAFAPPLPSAIHETNRILIGVLAIVLGSLGVHKFVLRKNTAGVIMLVVSIVGCFVGPLVMSIIGIVEGIIYLTMTDEDFYQTYVVGEREWF